MVIEDTSVAIAKKGLRKIVVGNETYYWKFTGTVFVFRDEGKFSQLSVDLGWKDIWPVSYTHLTLPTILLV